MLLQLARRCRPDAVVAGLPLGRDGLEVIGASRGERLATGVLVLSDTVEEPSAVALLEGGQAGLGQLLKDRLTDSRLFADAVRRVAAGGSVLDPEVVSQLLASRPGAPDRAGRLTAREREVMAMMADGLTNRAMATRLAVGERAVERHVSGIFEKLGLRDDGACHRRVLAVLRYVRESPAPRLAVAA